MAASPPTKLAIAKALGVSRTCVSQVLNQIPNARISADTRKRIMDEARERGYVAAPVHRSAVASGDILYAYCHRQPFYKPSISHYWPQIVQELSQLCRPDDRSVSFLSTGIDARALEAFYRTLDVSRPMAVVLDGVVPGAILNELQQRNIPHIVMGTAAAALEERHLAVTNTVTSDYEQLIGEIMRWLHSRGCRRIAFSCGLLRTLVHSSAFEAYRNWVERLNLEFDPALVQFGEDATGSEIFTALGRLGVRHDGIILASVSRVVRALPYLPQPASNANRMRSVAVIGAPDVSTDWLSGMAICGPRCSDIARILYEIVCAEVNYKTKKRKHVTVPVTLVEAI